jgi:signal transduction histidine kinase
MTQNAEATEASRKHLLIVDDEPVILQILSAVFEDEPFRLTCTGSGADALRVLQEQQVDLLITDKNLPDVGGLELLRAAKDINPFTEVIIITGYASLETALTALELDAFDYVLKPLNNIFDIRKKVKQALEKQELALENRNLLDHLRVKNGELEMALAESRDLQAELIQSEKLAGLGTLAAGIAHEVSSPLFGIMGLAEAIEDEEDGDLARGYARDIVEYSRNIRDIVVELSSYSRSAGQEYLTTVDLLQVIEDAQRLVERTAQLDGVRFEVDVPAELFIHARTNEVQQVFVNLMKNAAEAVLEAESAEEGVVRVEAGPGDGHVWIRVSDTGVGIPEDKISVVFDPFYTTKPPGKGTGLGLNIVYRILTKYRGSVHVESSPANGTTFHMRFPVQS